MPTAGEPWHIALPTHTTAWRAHLWIAHCVIIRDGREVRDLERTGFEHLHDDLHAEPRKGAVHHIHTARPAADPEHWDDDIW